ncbi:MAG: GHMP kinase, partial [Verrucomicrobia bacterium]|nr:GHMP kinase [Verrucomicrobiota bacterium]
MRENLHNATASAPGTLMLMGEHAVLHGHRALCAAVDPRISVSLHPRQDRRLRVVSALGEMETDLKSLEPVPPFTFVMEAVRRSGIHRGLDLDIQSGFSAEIGFGSSAAVTVATVAGGGGGGGRG